MANTNINQLPVAITLTGNEYVPLVVGLDGSAVTKRAQVSQFNLTGDSAGTAQTANLFFAGPASGSAAFPTFRVQVPADLPGNAISAFAIGDLLYASSTTALAKLADVAAGSVLVSGGVGVAPAYSNTPSLTSLTLSNAGNPLTVTNSRDGAGLQQVALFAGAHSVGAAADTLYQSFTLNNASGAAKEFGRLKAQIVTATASSEDGRFIFSIMKAGTTTDVLVLDSTAGAISLRPTSGLSGSLDLGVTSTNLWGNVFLASGKKIDWASGNVTLTQSSSQLTLAGQFNVRPTTTTQALSSSRSLSCTITGVSNYGSAGEYNDCNPFYITSDNSDTGWLTAASVTYDIAARHSFGGTSCKGGRESVLGWLTQTAATSSSNLNRNYVGGHFRCDTSSGDGGGAGTEKGAYFGANIEANALAGTHLLNITCCEFNLAAYTATSVKYKTMLQLFNYPVDQVQGSNTDAMVVLGSGSGAVQWQDGLLIGCWVQFPISATGTLIRSNNSGSCANGVDVSNTTFSGSAFKSTGFSVSGTGVTATKSTVAGTPALTALNSTDNASVAVSLLSGARATPANSDTIFQNWNLNSSTGVSRTAARTSARLTTVTNTAEVGQMFWSIMRAGTLTDTLVLTGTALAGITNNTVALGTSSLGYAGAFLASGTALDFGGGNVTLTHASGSLTIAGGVLKPVTGTTALAPIQFTSGVNLTSAAAGAVEYDGAQIYGTIDTSSGRGALPVEQYFHLTASGSNITNSIANFFGSSSNIVLVASAYYIIDIVLFYTINTGSQAVTWTLTNSAAPTSQNIYYEASPITGVVAPPGTATALVGQIIGDATAAKTITTGSLTNGVNHYTRMRIYLQNGTGTSLLIQATAGASNTLTPLRNSYWFCRRISPSNIGTFAS